MKADRWPWRCDPAQEEEEGDSPTGSDTVWFPCGETSPSSSYALIRAEPTRRRQRVELLDTGYNSRTLRYNKFHAASIMHIRLRQGKTKGTRAPKHSTQRQQRALPTRQRCTESLDATSREI